MMACLTVPTLAQAQTYACIVESYGVFGHGYPTAFQVTYEPAGTAVVQHHWRGERHAVRVEADDRGQYGTRMTYRIRLVDGDGERVIFSFRLLHHRDTDAFSSEIQPLRYREVASRGNCQPG